MYLLSASKLPTSSLRILLFYISLYSLSTIQLLSNFQKINCKFLVDEDLHTGTTKVESNFGIAQDQQIENTKKSINAEDKRLQLRQTSTSSLVRANPYSSFDLNDQVKTVTKCCACEEAKYMLVFEGLWSRNTHPDSFPEDPKLALFSELIGASHSDDLSIWEEDQLASAAVRDLAINGSTKYLESELKQVSMKIRTIIRAREIKYPILNSKTNALFRTDKKHHLLSVVSKIQPSPDWLVGVSNLDLCQPDCSWVPQKTVDLYLWDAGLDESFTHTMSKLQIVPDKIRSLKEVVASVRASYEVSQGSFDVNQATQIMSPSILGDVSKPFARLTLTRKELYNLCNDTILVNETRPSWDASNLGRDYLDMSLPKRISNFNCKTSDWSDWSLCSSTCGKGLRTKTRFFINGGTDDCKRDILMETETCLSECISPNVTCITHDWKEWSPCSVRCGRGRRQRTRSLIGPSHRECSSVELIEQEVCFGSSADCPLSDMTTTNDRSNKGTNICRVTPWSPWSECSDSCANTIGGYKLRSRTYINPDSQKYCSEKLSDKIQCRTNSKKEGCPGVNDDGKPVDCQLGSWSPWSKCDNKCTRLRHRKILKRPTNGGKKCERRVVKEKCECNKQATTENNKTSSNQSTKEQSSDDSNDKNGCIYGDWTLWSQCEVICKPVRVASTKIRRKLPLKQSTGKCDIIQELYYCDPDIYCQ